MEEQKEYHVFVLTREGQVQEHYEMHCKDEAQARQCGRKFFTVYPVEVWDGPRRIARIGSKISN